MFFRFTMKISILMLMIAQSSYVYAENGLVIRFGPCTANAFLEAGTDLGDDIVKDMNVNCTTETSDKSQFNMYTTGIGGHDEYCVSTIADLEQKKVKVVADPTADDSLNCQVSGNVNDIAEFLTRYNGS